MEAQDRIHEVALTDLQGRFEFLNLRIDQVMESQEMRAAIAKNSKKIKEIDEALIRQGLKDA
jgi:pimeloyl-CoA synthetase